MAKIRDAIQNGDSHVLMAEAHALKGGVGNFFATTVYETANQLEMMGRDNETANAAETFATLETQLEALKQAIRELINK